MKLRAGQNLGLLLLSILLAFFFWAVATETENPTAERTYPASISVEVRGVDQERMMAYGAEGVKARVVLRAPQSVWDILQLEDIRAYVDLSDASTGEITAPVHIEVLRGPVQVVESSPQEITLNLEPLAEKEIPVVVTVSGTPSLGFVARSPTYAPRAVLVKGPESKVDEVTRAAISVSVSEQRQSVTGDFQPAPVDETGNVVAYVQAVPKTVTVKVPIEQLGNIRDVAVRVILAGQPAPGFRVGAVTVDPPVVTVIGRLDVVQDIAGYVETEPIGLQEAAGSFTTTVGLQVPEGLSVLLTPQVLVTVNLEAVESSLTVQIEPEIQGLEPTLTVTVIPESVQIIATGPFEAIKRFDPASIRVILDLSGLSVGEHTVVPTVEIPDGTIRVDSILPQSSLTVVIEEAETAFEP
ncbi:MAG: hypothetical protein JXB35_06040 [Anaerolineae bacterium]|nr:hypothetical protein [Anaerolineae bacterium]